MATAVPKRQRGTIRQRGSSYQVVVYAGQDPVTGKRLYLTDSAPDAREAERIRRRFVGQVDEQRNVRTRVTLGKALESWLRTHEAEESTLDGYRGYIRRTIEPALGDVPIGKVTAQVLEEFYAELRRCRHRCRDGEPAVDHRTAVAHECREIRHKRKPGRPGKTPHDCAAAGCVVVECPPHTCTPMAASSIRQVHWILSAAFAAAVRWEWIRSNPAEVARKPKQRAPQPTPPTAAEAARIIEAAWAQDDEWGTLVWLVMVTGMRRAEVLALRWSDVDLQGGKLTISRSYVRTSRRALEKDTKTHQMRRISLDTATVEVLDEHRRRVEEQVRRIGQEPTPAAFLFSHKPLHDGPVDPSGVTHRYGRMCAELGIDSHLHALRHYSATELLTAGVDLRTVAGRLGHGGGGATTLRVYAAWVAEADQQAAEVLGSRMKRR
ncbi:site-specific integrase [Pseudonocardia sulfidoxydans NBRC 16205]|uniref:Site-specific integrase n=1 Tax=Pseudonocardia sulfidoxydans NBRC 16205 TaxID=1223511 RepID=A0A511DGC5_9PSEU|nr:tyrosine-type recombinase/integrase [Pseudonocardia sulfidoxydans]GEL23832.1 site-specific integrase [Pseudonocardia sulfidoxydans NBRC 16205]